MTLAPERPLTAHEARSALAAEWESAQPSTPDEILEFYRRSECLGDDLEAFHNQPERKRWTEILVHLAKATEAKVVVDIGSGAGHDLRALRDANVAEVYGVEPNAILAHATESDAIVVYRDVAYAPIERADVLSCIDVLEHVVDPESFLGSIAKRAKLGAMLLESVATCDLGTPLHLRANVGWKSGRVLEQNGWEQVALEGRARVWQRTHLEQQTRTAFIVCAYRAISLPTVAAMLRLKDIPNPEYGWRVHLGGEAGINRARSIAVSKWWADSADEVFLMVDDDIIFETHDAEKIVDECRNGHDIICAAYPVRDASHVALRGLTGEFNFGPNLPPVEVRHATTGFLAVHRRVLDTMIPTLPLCHANQPFAFWPMFDFKVIEDEMTGGYNYLSEDYTFSEVAGQLGFKSWLDPSIKIGHIGQVTMDIANMAKIREALG